MRERLTFLLPHQRASTGGVYAITQLASHLAAEHEVTLVVGKGPVHDVAGVKVILAPGLDPDAVPDADVLVGGLAQGNVDTVRRLPARVGERVFLFQGYGSPGNEAVRSALSRRPRVLAISTFLAEDARRAGCPVRQVALGLDRETFAPGPPAETRAPIVSMVAHTTDWKGTDDGLAALRLVERSFPGAELELFGEPPGSSPGRFLEGLSGRRNRIADQLRRASVFALPSWEEGLGLPGIEALACGAALATTDTRGGRDYALEGETALVSPARDPLALAHNVTKLLRDPCLRARLAAEGRRHVLACYPPWDEAADRFLRAVHEVLAERPAPALPS